jgi:hypothetical protein
MLRPHIPEVEATEVLMCLFFAYEDVHFGEDLGQETGIEMDGEKQRDKGEEKVSVREKR